MQRRCRQFPSQPLQCAFQPSSSHPPRYGAWHVRFQLKRRLARGRNGKACEPSEGPLKPVAARRIARRMSRPSEVEDGVAPAAAAPDCPQCHKPVPLCVCDGVTPVESRIDLLILQHPQEQDRMLGTARLAAMHFEKAVLKIGLSWPSLSKALGRPVADPSRWAVLYLGSAKAADLDTTEEVVAISRKGEMAEHQRAILREIEGVVLLDGTWSQAKALWWRNAWMLKCQRVILGPAQPSH